MKAFKALTVLVLCLLVASFQASASGLRSGFNDYKIEAVDDFVPGNNVEKVWNLTYNNSDKPVVVEKRKSSDGVYYVVTNEFFEVCYSCTSKGFGARTVKNAWSCVPREINDVVLNQEELKNQKVILPSKVDDEKALGLIASYLPNLLNEGYTHLLN
jgi:hypothetical protein